MSYGQFDFDWLIGNLTSHIKNGKCYLGLQHRALYAFEDFLISRFHMFLMVYFHYKSVVFDEMLGSTSKGRTALLASCRYREIRRVQRRPSYSHLAQSKNEWARRIADKRPFRMLVELTVVFRRPRPLLEQDRLVNRIQKDLNHQGIEYLMKTSTGELSKYFRKPGDPIFVRYDNHYSKLRVLFRSSSARKFFSATAKSARSRDFTFPPKTTRSAEIKAGALRYDSRITKKNPLA